MRTTGHTILVTGGGSGIGRALALRLLRAGNTVIVTGRRGERLAELAAAHPEIETHICDICADDQVSGLARALGNRVSILINNAGVLEEQSLGDGADLSRQIAEVDINLNGMLRMIHAFAPSLRAQPEAAIVNVTSATAFVAEAKAPVYSATKAAQHALTMALRHQLRDSPVRVFELIPPLTDTPMAAHVTGIRKLSADRVAQALLDGLARDRVEIAPGLSRVARILARIAPRRAFALLNG